MPKRSSCCKQGIWELGVCKEQSFVSLNCMEVAFSSIATVLLSLPFAMARAGAISFEIPNVINLHLCSSWSWTGCFQSIPVYSRSGFVAESSES